MGLKPRTKKTKTKKKCSYQYGNFTILKKARRAETPRQYNLMIIIKQGEDFGTAGVLFTCEFALASSSPPNKNSSALMNIYSIYFYRHNFQYTPRLK